VFFKQFQTNPIKKVMLDRPQRAPRRLSPASGLLKAAAAAACLLLFDPSWVWGGDGCEALSALQTRLREYGAALEDFKTVAELESVPKDKFERLKNKALQISADLVAVKTEVAKYRRDAKTVISKGSLTSKRESESTARLNATYASYLRRARDKISSLQDQVSKLEQANERLEQDLSKSRDTSLDKVASRLKEENDLLKQQLARANEVDQKSEEDDEELILETSTDDSSHVQELEGRIAVLQGERDECLLREKRLEKEAQELSNRANPGPTNQVFEDFGFHQSSPQAPNYPSYNKNINQQQRYPGIPENYQLQMGSRRGGCDSLRKFEFNSDRSGPFFQSERVEGARRCREVCMSSSRCQGWVYVKAQAMCYLKDAPGASMPNECCVSGLRCA